MTTTDGDEEAMTTATRTPTIWMDPENAADYGGKHLQQGLISG